MLVTAISKDQMFQIALPEKVKGQYWLYSGDDKNQKLVSLEGIDGKWIVKSNKKYKIVDNDKKYCKTKILRLRKEIILEDKNKDKIFIFSEAITEDRQIFQKYIFKGDIKLQIGRSGNNDICFTNNIVSSNHATLVFNDGKWLVKDNSSTNGTFVNYKRIDEQQLVYGDVVTIMGLKIIVGKNLIALNNPDGKVKISNKLNKFIPQEDIVDDEEDEDIDIEDDFFFRSPRFKRDIETANFKIDSPPASPIANEMPIALVLGTSLAMGMMSVVTLSNAIITQNIMSMCMGGSMLIGTLLLPIITKTYDKRKKYRQEKLRQKKYQEYLDSVESKINDEILLQEEILHENIVPVKECEQRILQTKRNLWEREMGQNDYLLVRLGLGSKDLDAKIEYSEPTFSIEDDNLEDELHVLGKKDKKLENVPIAVSLFENYISGIIGKKQEMIEFAKGIIFQLSAFYGYDELKFVFIYDKQDEKYLEFVKWLPHVWSDDNRFRFIASDKIETKEVSAYLENVIASRNASKEGQIAHEKPYYIIFSFSKLLSSQSEAIKSLLATKANLQISLLAFYNELKELPKECSVVIELKGQESKIFDLSNIKGDYIEFDPDIKLISNAEDLSIKLANTFLDNSDSGAALPQMVSFLQLFNVGKIEHLNAFSRWKENDPTKTLEAAVGVDTQGGLFSLDLHEKFHGPHGLVAGMTGSGKSEFIISYILSLAVNYHPEEVAFILIDYKGGGMAKSFEHLPHTVGIITNLDGAAINRSLVSIESELKRRQSIFSEASKKVGISNIDIYKYQRLYREGKVDEPLQHLFIISDEFAELKTQRPEFMTQLVSAARIGRSLGVHLILATQKPSGVVDDQIWSNSRFRVCLKVQERADSMDMLKRPDAAELVETGRFYLQVGYNELFEIGQSAWSGAPYYPSDTVLIDKDETVSVLDKNGHIVTQTTYDSNSLKYKNPPKQVDEITKYLQEVAQDENIKIKPLWLEPIPAVILINELISKYHIKSKEYFLNPLIGEYDDPANQQQCAFTLPITEEGNVVVYGAAGTGKTTFLNAMLFSLINSHTPDELSLYLLDFASETLRAFETAPHVGDVMLSYEEEKITNMFKMLKKEADKRKKLFADFGGDYSSYIDTSGEKLPSIVIVINNFAAFTEIYEDLEAMVSFLSREGTKFGIYFVLTAVGTNAVKFRLLQNFKQLISLQLNDPTDYASIVGRTEGLFPSKYKGRGLVRIDKLYEFQAAHITKEEVPYFTIQKTCIDLSQKWKGKKAAKVPVLPERVNNEFISSHIDFDKNSLPIGVEKNSLKVYYYPFDSNLISMIISSGDEFQGFTNEIAQLLDIYYKRDFILFDPLSTTGDLSIKNIVSDNDSIEKSIDDLFNELVKRNNKYKKAKDKNAIRSKFKDFTVIINSYAALKSSLSTEGKDKLRLILDKACKEYNIRFIIGDQTNQVSTYTYDEWYKTNVDGVTGIWVGNGFSEQYQIKPQTTNRQMRAKISSDYGYAVVNGEAVLVKLLNNNEEVDE